MPSKPSDLSHDAEIDPAEALQSDSHRDLNHAGAVVEKAIEHLVEQQLDMLAIASALLAGALGLLLQTVGPDGTAQVLGSALATVKAGDLPQTGGIAGRS